jgi:trimethylamine:corrinoid methyltransferase-like protein
MMSLEQIVVDEEIAALCRRIREGVDVSTAKNYFEDVAAVKPGGHFLARSNTRRACRSNEFSLPALCDRSSNHQWMVLGQPDMYKKARTKVEEILSSPLKNPLSDDVIGKLDEIVRKADHLLKKESN